MAVTQFRDGQMKGEVQGPASSTDNAIPRYDGTTGKLLQDSGITIPTSNAIDTGGGTIATFNITAGQVETDTILEDTTGVGVTIDSVLLKDGEVDGKNMDDVVEGPASATDNAIARFDGTGGKTIQDSGVRIDDSGTLTIPNQSTGADVDISATTSAKLLSIDGLLNVQGDGTSFSSIPRLDVNIALRTNTINENAIGSGVTIDSVLLKDGEVDGRDVATDGTKLDGIESGAEVNNISDANATDLTDSGTTTLHSHAINNGDWSGTDLAVVNGGTGASTASTALSNLGGIGAATTDTLTNKTIDADNNTVSNIGPAERTGGFKVGRFTMNASTGSQSITGVGFEPKMIEFHFAPSTTTGSFFVMQGMTDGTTSQVTGAAGTTSGASRWSDTTKCIRFDNVSGTTIGAAAFTSLDSDGFTINVTNGNAQTIYYKAYA